MTTKKLFVVSLCLACGVALLPATKVFADCETCLPSFTQVPDFIVSGDGSCKHNGTGVNGGLPTDTLEITVPDDPKCHQCTVTVTATWVGGSETSPEKGPGTHAGGYWPHKV